MTATRRSFLGAILGAAAAPAIVSASSLMKVVPAKPDVLIYKATGRYDLTSRVGWFEEYVSTADSTIALRPTKLLVPAMMADQALKILNAEFDRLRRIA